MANTTPNPKANSSRATYGAMVAIIIGLVLVIGYFVFLLVKPDPVAEPSSNVNTIENTALTNSTNTNTSVTTVTEEDEPSLDDEAEDSEEDETNTDDAADEESVDAVEDEGLIQPEADEDGETFTLYFPKSSSDCGEVFPVERTQALSEDTYGDIILAAMYGPNADETGYVDPVPNGVYLRQVQYSAEGPVITVSEGYDELTTCQQATVEASLVATANAMFELPEGTDGQVIVGEYEELTLDASNASSEDE